MCVRHCTREHRVPSDSAQRRARRVRAIARRIGAGLRTRERDAPAGALRVPRRRLRRTRDRDVESSIAGAPRDGRSAGGHGQGVGRGAHSVVDRLSAEFRSREKMAALQTIHGGPHAAPGHVAFPWNTQVFAGRGNVAAVNYHAPRAWPKWPGDRRPLQRGIRRRQAGTDWLLPGLHRPRGSWRPAAATATSVAYERPHRPVQTFITAAPDITTGSACGDRVRSLPTSWARFTGTIRRASPAVSTPLSTRKRRRS